MKKFVQPTSLELIVWPTVALLTQLLGSLSGVLQILYGLSPDEAGSVAATIQSQVTLIGDTISSLPGAKIAVTFFVWVLVGLIIYAAISVLLLTIRDTTETLDQRLVGEQSYADRALRNYNYSIERSLVAHISVRLLAGALLVVVSLFGLLVILPACVGVTRGFSGDNAAGTSLQVIFGLVAECLLFYTITVLLRLVLLRQRVYGDEI